MNVLLTSVGRRTYLVRYFQQALNGAGKVFASNSVMTYSMLQADEYVLTPQIYDNTYISFLLRYCKQKQISVIISCFDIDLPVLSANKDLFEKQNVRVIISDLDVTRICNDKWKTYLKIKKMGLNTPKTFLSLEEVLNVLRGGELFFPLILKPRWGMGSIGIYKADNMEELLILYKKLKRDIFKTYLKFESEADKDNCIVIQEQMNSQEYGLDVLNDLNGNFVTVIAKRKNAMRAGETDIAEIVDNKPFYSVARTLSSEMKHIANLDVDVFMGEDNKIYILEMNARFGGQYPFSHVAGANFPLQIIEWLKGFSTKQELITPKIGVIGCKDLTPVVLGGDFEFNNTVITCEE